MKPSILLTLNRGIERIAQAILEQADLDLIVLYDATKTMLEARDMPCRALSEFLTKPLEALAQHEAIRRARQVSQLLHTTEFEQAYPEHAASPGRVQALRAQILEAIRKDFIAQTTWLDALSRCASETDLRLVVVHQDVGRDTRTVIAQAQRLGVPSLQLLHGYPYGTLNLHDVLRTDMIAVYSDEVRDIYRSIGVESERIVVTGNPEWDIHAHPVRPGLRKHVAAMLNIDPSRPTVLFAMPFMHRLSRANAEAAHAKDRTAEAVLDAFEALRGAHPDWQFVLRPHPGDPAPPGPWYERVRRQGVTLDTEVSSAGCLALADVFVCMQSNMAIEAIMMGRQVVNVLLAEFGPAVFEEGLGPLFHDGDAVETVQSSEEIAPAIDAALTNPEHRREFLSRRPATIARFNTPHDGLAAERFAALVLEPVKNGQRWAKPVDRYPETEPLLAALTPETARRVLVRGKAASYVVETLRLRVPNAEIAVETAGAPWDAVVFSDPMPHSPDAARQLATAREALAENGVVVAWFRSGATLEAYEALRSGRWSPPRFSADHSTALGQYSLAGVEQLLADANLIPLLWQRFINATCESAFRIDAPLFSQLPADVQECMATDFYAVQAGKE